MSEKQDFVVIAEGGAQGLAKMRDFLVEQGIDAGIVSPPDKNLNS